MLNEKQTQLVAENHNLIYWYAHTNDLDLEEWYGLLAITLCESVQIYKEDLGALSTFFKLRADNMVNNELRKLYAQKRKKEVEVPYEDFNEVISEEHHYEIFDLSWIEPDVREIIELKMEGYTQNEIAHKMDISQSYVSKILSRIKDEFKERI